MEHYYAQRRIYTTILALAALFALFMTSCGTGSPKDADRKKVLSYLKDSRVQTDGADGGLYDVSSLISGTGKTVCAYGMYDEKTLVLLSAEDRPDFGSERESPLYTADLVDLTNGKRRELSSFRCEGTLEGFSDGTQFLKIISADPLVVYDELNGRVLMPQMTPASFILPKWLYGATVSFSGGKVILSSDRGILYEITGNGSLNALWKLPYTYRALTSFAAGHEGKLTFCTFPVGGSSPVLVDIDPVSGESLFYQSDLTQEDFTCARDGLLLGTSFSGEPGICVCSPGGAFRKELLLPESLRDRISGHVAGDGDDGPQDSREETGGGFVSMDTAPLSLCSDWCCWSLSDSNGRPEYLYLWDTASARQTDWEVPSESAWQAPSPSDLGDVSARAAKLQDQYGVKIVLGSDVPTVFADYSADPETDPDMIGGTLSVLENVLCRYPEGFFNSLRGIYYRDIVFYLTGDLRPLDSEFSISNAGAFATECDGLCQIALNLGSDPDPSMVIHELTHAVDYRFAGEGLFDEDEWNAMNPAGFSYYGSYIDENGKSYEFSGSREYTAEGGSPDDEVYFIDAYSKTFGMEDRARLMENLMISGSPYADCYSGRHVQEKLSYYFRFLRENLGDSSWPPLTKWEEALESASLK